MGFSPAIIFAGGGFVAINGNASWKNWKTFYDDSDDHFWIAAGIYTYSIIDPVYRIMNPIAVYAFEATHAILALTIYKAVRDYVKGVR